MRETTSYEPLETERERGRLGCRCCRMGGGIPVERFRGGLVCKAHRLLYHPTLGLRVIKKKGGDRPVRLEEEVLDAEDEHADRCKSV